MALGSTQPLMKMSTKNIPVGKGGRCLRLTTSPPSCAECHEKSGSLNLLEPYGSHRACYGIPLPFFYIGFVSWTFVTCNGYGAFFYHVAAAPSGLGPPHYRRFVITFRRSTVDRTPLDKWSARRRDFYLTVYNTHQRQTSMLPAGFEPTNRAGQRAYTARPLGSAYCAFGWYNKRIHFSKCHSIRLIWKLFRMSQHRFRY